MATLVTQVDRQIGNYEQVFVYTINASFNGVVGDIETAEIRVFLPDYFNMFLGDIQKPVKEVREEIVVGGKVVVFDFGQLTDLGVAVRLGFGVTFQPTAQNGQIYTCSPTLWINGEEQIISQSDPITLQVEHQFELTRQIVLPIAPPAAGSAVFYKVTLENFGDLGASIQNTQIFCNGSDLVTLDADYPVSGKDVSEKFSDTSADGLRATIENNVLTFSLPAYRGQRYEFIYRAVIDEALEVGTELVTTASLGIDTEPMVEEVHEVTLADRLYDANISMYAPDYSLPAEYLCYRMNIQNTGNQILQQVVFENNLPPEVDYYQFSTGAFHIAAIDVNLSATYFIDYVTKNNVTGQVGPFNTDASTVVDLSTVLPQGDGLATLFWRLQTLGIGVQTRVAPELRGIVKPDIAIDTSLVNHIHLTFVKDGQTVEQVENATTLLANYCTLQPSLSSSVNKNPVRPGEVIRFTLQVNCRNSRLKNPILACLLPKELDYVGNESYNYTDIFENTTPPTPVVRLLPDFDDEGNTLLKFEFKDENAFSFRQLATIRIRFDVRVAVGAIGSVRTFLLLNTFGSTGVIPPTTDIYTDVDNIAEDITVSRNYAKSNTIENRILYFVSTSSNKKVKGLLDDAYMEEPTVGKTVDGGSLIYLISVKNIGNATLDQIEVVDILPFVGDTGVIETKTPRNSAFPIYALSEVVATLLPEEEVVAFDIQYSTSTDPVRFGPNFNVIGTDDNWTEQQPNDLSQLRAFKVTTKDTTVKPGQSLKVSITASVPVGVDLGNVAWNSFATDVLYTDLSGTKQHLLAMEPEKVGVSIENPVSGMVRIAGDAWIDGDLDGFYTDGEVFANDVTVLLYDETGQLIRFTATRTDSSGIDGQYLFENLSAGKYYVKFLIDDQKLKFTTQQADAPNGSKADRKTGITPLIDLTEQTEATSVSVGIVAKGKHTLQEIFQINQQARGLVRDVIKNQMLLTMKQEDVIDLIENQ